MAPLKAMVWARHAVGTSQRLGRDGAANKSRGGTRSGWRGNIAGSLKQDNCQVAVSLSLANRHASLPVAWRLYLPQEWAADPARRRKAHVPADITFKTKAEIALDQLRWACAAGLPRGVVLLAAGYGNHS